jgi:hypothetical protein
MIALDTDFEVCPHPYQVDHGGQRRQSTGWNPRLIGHRRSAPIVVVRACWCQPVVSDLNESLDVLPGRD